MQRVIAPEHPAASAPTLRIQLLGGFHVAIGSRSIEDRAWRLRKARSLIKLLALAPGHRLHREQVTDQFWPELEPDAAVNNLHYTLHVARRCAPSAQGKGSRGKGNGTHPRPIPLSP